MMNNEYIVPMTEQTRNITLYPSHGGNGRNGQPLEGIPSCSLSASLKPQMCFSSPCFVRSDEITSDAVEIGSPEVPLDVLKNLTVDMLTAGVWAVGQGVRDPVGGSTELLLVPLIRLFYTLLVMGALGDEELVQVLKLVEPGVLDAETPEEEEKEEASDEDEEERQGGRKEDDNPEQGLLQMKLPEAVKLEVKCFFFSLCGIYLD